MTVDFTSLLIHVIQ